MDQLSQDERFMVLLHKKIMNKKGSAKRRAKKYYVDQYRKTGIIPQALQLAGQGIMEGRKCSGRKRVLCEAVKNRFVEMVKASSDPLDPGFIFITQKARKIKTYHQWLQEEFGRKISLAALRRYARETDLAVYLHKPDFEEDQSRYAFKDEKVFDLVQIDGCVFQYLKIRRGNGLWQKPNVIEFYDTGARYFFALDVFFSESSLNAVDVFSQFLLSTPFPQKKIRLRPDGARGFENLKRVIQALNIQHSVPDGFFLQADFARAKKPKDKVHLESSHRSLHNFEIRIIKAFEKRIAKTEPGYLFKNGRKRKIIVTYLDITLEELRCSGMIEVYRRMHNDTKHFFSVNGKTRSWIPAQKLEEYMSRMATISFSADSMKGLMRYGFEKKPATVSPQGTLTFNKRKYIVVDGAEKFSRHQSTKVCVSAVNDKLYIFERKEDGILVGEAICQVPYEGAEYKPKMNLKTNEVERMIAYLSEKGMVVDREALIERHRKGLTLVMAQNVYEGNKSRYDEYLLKLRQPPRVTGSALFNAFVLDCIKHQRKSVYGAK